MASDIRNYATLSGFISSSMSMRNKVAKPKIYLYVEDDLDKAFWRKIFQPYAQMYDFDISVFQNPTGEDVPGKDFMLKCVENNTLKLSSHVMCCVDADYDLLIDVPGKYSKLVRNNAYIIHTHWYSIESLKCFPQGQYEDFAYRVSLPVSKISFDFQNCLHSISSLLSKLILFTILDKKLNLNIFSIKDLRTFVGDYEIFNPDLTLRDDFVQAAKNKELIIQPHVDSNKAEYDTIETTLNSMGYTPKDYYCIMQGHTLLDNISTKIVKVVSEPIRKAWFGKLEGNAEQKKLAANHYANNTGVKDSNSENLNARISSMFRDYYDFKQTEAYAVIQKRINKALASEKLLTILDTISKKGNSKTDNR